MSEKSLTTFLSEWGGQVKAMIENSSAQSSSAINFIDGTCTVIYKRLTSDYTNWHGRIENVSFSNNPTDYIKISVNIPMDFRLTYFAGWFLSESAIAFRQSGSNSYPTYEEKDAKRIIPAVIVNGEIDPSVLTTDTIYYFRGSSSYLVFSASLLPTSSEDAFIIVYSDYDD